MCQAQPGPRCFNDSSKKLTKIHTKLVKAEGDLGRAKKELASVARKSDFNAYSKIRKNVKTLEDKVNALASEYRHTQRDVDSTLTGRKSLEASVHVAKTKAELEELDIRRRTAEALRFNREHALELKNSGYVPAIRFAS